ncbi:endonuclease domain-containing protein [Mesorhizobium sp.]|uniref:endonuclease domain-containing protein n=1 Tax=Mesorhizobium sp. TaxID=1871066 RepID=UPI00345C7E78
MTEAEDRLWHELRDRRLDRIKFRRQVPIGKYIADFVCFEAGLVVEIDGSQHAELDLTASAKLTWKRKAFAFCVFGT